MLGLNYGIMGTPFGFAFPTPYSKCNRASRENNEQYFDTFINLVDIFMNTFEWINLPETCNERALETTLLFDGKALFFKHHDNGGFYNCPFNFDGSKMNFYGEFNVYKTNAPTYQNIQYDDTNSVVIRATKVMYPFWLTLDIYARKLYDNCRTIDVYTRTMKRPFILSGTKEMEVSLKHLMSKVDENEYYWILNKDALNPDVFKVVPVPSEPQNLYALWDNLHNNQAELHKRMGIFTTQIDKAERLVKDEASSADNVTTCNILMMLDSRKKACEMINEMFGLNVDVKLRNRDDELSLDEDNSTPNEGASTNNGGDQNA